MLHFLVSCFFIVVFLAIRVGIGKKQSARDYIRSWPFNYKRHEQFADMLALLATEENREMNDKTITMDEALSFVIGHSEWNTVSNKFAAARRLIEAGITRAELDRMNLPGGCACDDITLDQLAAATGHARPDNARAGGDPIPAVRNRSNCPWTASKT